MMGRLLLVAGAVLGAAAAGGVTIAAGAPVAAVVIATVAGLLVGAAAGQGLVWLRVTAGRAARTEQQLAGLNQRVADARADLDALRAESSQRDQDLRQHLGTQREVTHKLIRDSRKVLTGQINEQTKKINRRVDSRIALLEAFIQLQRLVPLDGPMPRPGTWAASEDLLLWLAGDVLERRPSVIVDLGSGQSSVWMAAALRAGGVPGKVVAIDHDAGYAAATADLGRRQGVSAWLDVVHAPLVEVTVDGRTMPWYDPSAFDGLTDIGLVSIDGPPGAGAEQARWPALPMLHDRLAPGARVVLDDMIRDDEQSILADYRERFPGLNVEALPFEKGAVVLTLP